MQHRHLVKGLIAGLALLTGGLAAQQSPAAHASGPAMSVGAAHTAIDVSGTGFSTSGRTVYLYAYGLTGSGKVSIASTSVVPLTASQPVPPCLFGVLCNAGSFYATMYQAQDPCYGAGYSHVEVDAWTHGPLGKWYRAASATTTVTCPPPAQ